MDKNIENFHLNRISFAIINHKLVHTMFDKRDHRQWLREAYSTTDEEFEHIIRGYCKDGSIYFYEGSDFKPVDLSRIGNNVYNHLQMLSMVYMNTSRAKCYNGIHVGEANEIWEPIHYMGTIDEVISQRFRSYGICV